MALPTLYQHNPGVGPEDVLLVSRISACVVTFVYVLFLVFQLRTHLHLFSSDEEEEEEPELSVVTSTSLLVLITVVVAQISEFLVDSIEGVPVEFGLPKAFIG